MDYSCKTLSPVQKSPVPFIKKDSPTMENQSELQVPTSPSNKPLTFGVERILARDKSERFSAEGLRKGDGSSDQFPQVQFFIHPNFQRQFVDINGNQGLPGNHPARRLIRPHALRMTENPSGSAVPGRGECPPMNSVPTPIPPPSMHHRLQMPSAPSVLYPHHHHHPHHHHGLPILRFNPALYPMPQKYPPHHFLVQSPHFTPTEESHQQHHHHHRTGENGHLNSGASTGTSASGKRKRSWSRAVFSNLQRKGLEIAFGGQKYITKPDRRKLAARLGLTDAQVKVWFQNRRMKWRHTGEDRKAVAGAASNGSGTGNEKKDRKRSPTSEEMYTSSDEEGDSVGEEEGMEEEEDLDIDVMD